MVKDRRSMHPELAFEPRGGTVSQRLDLLGRDGVAGARPPRVDAYAADKRAVAVFKQGGTAGK